MGTSRRQYLTAGGAALLGASGYEALTRAIESDSSVDYSVEAAFAPDGKTQPRISAGQNSWTDGFTDADTFDDHVVVDGTYETVLANRNRVLLYSGQTAAWLNLFAGGNSPTVISSEDTTLHRAILNDDTARVLSAAELASFSGTLEPISRAVSGDLDLIATDQYTVCADDSTLFVIPYDTDQLTSINIAESPRIQGVQSETLCAGGGQIYFCDTSGTVLTTTIDRADGDAHSQRLRDIGQFADVTGMAYVDERLFLQTPSAIAYVDVATGATDTKRVVSETTRPVTNGSELLTYSDETVTHFTVDESIEQVAQYHTGSEIRRLHGAGRHAVATTVDGTTIVDLSTGEQSRLDRQVMYAGAAYRLSQSTGRTHIEYTTATPEIRNEDGAISVRNPTARARTVEYRVEGGRGRPTHGFVSVPPAGQQQLISISESTE